MRYGAPRAILEEGRRGKIRQCKARVRLPDRGSLRGDHCLRRGYHGGLRVPFSVQVPAECGGRVPAGSRLAGQVGRDTSNLNTRCCVHLILVQIHASIVAVSISVIRP